MLIIIGSFVLWGIIYSIWMRFKWYRYKRTNKLAASSQACDDGNIRLVEAMIQSRANVNEQNRVGTPPLIIATCHGYPQIVSLLLQHGAETERCDHEAYTPVLMLNGTGLPYHVLISK